MTVYPLLKQLTVEYLHTVNLVNNGTLSLSRTIFFFIPVLGTVLWPKATKAIYTM